MSARLLKDPATVSSRIFVGHLQTDDMTKHELEEHFSKYGTVVGSLINRGFGFVQFEEEQSAQKAIQNEDGAMFKGRRIDVRPAKKDNQSAGGGGGNNTSGGGLGPGINPGGGKQLGAPNNQFSPGNNHFNNANDSFGGGSQGFGGGNQSFNSNQGFGNDNQFADNQKGNNNVQNRGPGNDQFNDGNQIKDNGNDQFGGGNQARNNGNDQFNSPMQNRGNNQFNLADQNRSGNDQFAGGLGNQNRSGNQFGQGGNQNRLGGNQNRNSNNLGGNQNQSGNGGGGTPNSGGNRTRGSRGGKNRYKNRDNSVGNNFRDRSPINRGGRLDDKNNRDWDHKQGDRLRNNSFGRDTFNDSSTRYDEFKSSGPRDINMSFSNTGTSSSDYSNITAEKNDCEIIVVNKGLTEYAEAIEMRLQKIGLTVDLLFPNEDVLLSRVLGNIASRGCLYAVVVIPINQEHHSLTLNILHGLPQEHRNMPVEDAINLISRDFSNYKAGGRSVPLNTPFANERHPDAIQVLLNMLADNHQLTVLQYDRVIKYLEIKREEQVQVELGDAKDLPTTTTLTVSDPKQAELQSRILNILNSNKTSSSVPAPSPVPAPTPTPAPVPPANWAAASTTATTSTTTTTTGVSPSPLLNDPTVQKALDSLLQGNLLKSIGDQQPAATTTPLFAAFPNIGRF